MLTPDAYPRIRQAIARFQAEPSVGYVCLRLGTIVPGLSEIDQDQAARRVLKRAVARLTMNLLNQVCERGSETTAHTGRIHVKRSGGTAAIYVEFLDDAIRLEIEAEVAAMTVKKGRPSFEEFREAVWHALPGELEKAGPTQAMHRAVERALGRPVTKPHEQDPIWSAACVDTLAWALARYADAHGLAVAESTVSQMLPPAAFGRLTPSMQLRIVRHAGAATAPGRAQRRSQ